MAGPSEENANSPDERVDDLLLEYNERLDAGEPISPEDFIAEHDEFREQLCRYFDNVVAVESLAGPRAEEEIEGTVIAGETHDGGFAETMIENSSSGNAARINKDAPLTQFGRYRIRKELGRGAMGAVYLAHDEQLDREVALKIPKFEADENVDLLERFYREARAAAALQHSGICPVFDVGELDGQHYITMAFVKGRPLRDFTKSSKRQKGKQVARVIRKVAMAMAEAHEHNVVHRDLKPANIMINLKNEPVVMDFGLARRSAEGEEQLTHTGTVIGTPAYMSPEQVDGDNENVGPHSDTYSLGVIFYEMLTGQLPFQGNLMSILKQIALTEPQPPIEIHADIDPSLQAICLKMMAKKSEDRPDSMSDVARDLTMWLQGRQVVADEAEPLETSRVPGQSKDEEVSVTTPVDEPAPAIVVQEPEATLTRGRKRSAEGNQPDRRKLMIAGGLGGAVILLGAIVFFVRLGKVNVQITVDDPSLALKVDGDEIVIEGNNAPIRLSAGTHQLIVQQGGLEFEAEEFKVTKDGKNAIHVVVANERVHLLLNGATSPVSPPPSGRSEATVAVASPRLEDSAIGQQSLQPLTAAEILTSPDWDWTEPVNPGAPINSPADDGDPFLSSNGLTLFFSSDRQLGSDKDIWMSTRPAINSPWSDPVNVKGLNSPRLDARPRLSPDGRTMIFRSSREGGQGSWDLWMSTRESISTDWHSPRNLGPNVNTPKEEGGHQFSPDGLSLTFMSTRSGRQQTYVTQRASQLSTEWSLAERFDRQGLPSFGVERSANDLYATHRSGINSWPLVQRSRASTDMPWGPPTVITVPGNEEAKSFQDSYRSECISNDGRTMLFAATRPGGVGNWDIWMSRRRHKSLPQTLTVESKEQPQLAVAPFDADQAKAHQKAWAEYLNLPVKKDIELPGGETMTFVLIPPGEFMMGSTVEEQATFLEEARKAKDKFAIDQIPSEGPQHRVRITQPFYMAKHEVTQTQWLSVMQNNPSQFNENSTHPVEGVSWDDIQPLLAKLNEAASADKMTFVLPTEAQWEYACRAGTTQPYYVGESEDYLLEYGWFRANSGGKPHPVGELKRNAFGLYDMHGNVAEWCADFFAVDFYERSTVDDPTGPSSDSSRVDRGGSWGGHPWHCRSAFRLNGKSDRRGNNLGFRLAMTIDAEKPKHRAEPKVTRNENADAFGVLTSPDSR